MKNVFGKLGNLIAKRYSIISIICLLLIIPAIFGASQVENKGGTETIASHDTREYKDYKRLTGQFSENVLYLFLRADSTEQLIQRDNILALEDFERQMSAQEHVISVVGPAFMIKMATGKDAIPDDQTISMMFKDPKFAAFFPDEEKQFLMGAQVTVEAAPEDKDLFEVVEIMDQLVAGIDFKDATAMVVGNPDVRAEVDEKMGESLKLMVMFALILMLVILALIFKARNFFAWRCFPLGVVFIGIIYTFGLMGLFGIELSVTTMAVFPILIGLGVGFTVQFHNRYDKAVDRGESPASAVVEAMTHIGPAIGTAVVVLCLGFAALLNSLMPMVVDFGYALIIGTIVMYLLSIFLLLPVLYWNDRRKESKKARVLQPRGEGFVERSLRKLSPIVLKSPIIIILLAVIICIAGYIVDSGIDAEPDVIQYMSDDLQSIKDINLLVELTGGRQNASILVEARDITDPSVLNWMMNLQETIKTEEIQTEEPKVGTVKSIVDTIKGAAGGAIPDAATTRQILARMPPALTLNSVNPDRTAANIALTFPRLSADELRDLRHRLEEYVFDPPDGVTASVTGSTIVQDKMSSGLTSDRMKMTLIGIGLVFAGVLLLFRFNLKRAVVAALPTVFIIGWAAIIVKLAGFDYTPVGATRAAMGMGIGVMFTILFMNRYYEERDNGQPPAEALTSTMVGVGRPIIACGLTVIGGFASLLMATDFPMISDFGVITLVTVFFGLVSTLIVLPPMIVLADSRFGQRAPRITQDPKRNSMHNTSRGKHGDM